jgi:predicted RND superfamily exporter protein
MSVVVLTGVLAYFASTLHLYDDPNEWPPHHHPYVQLNNELQVQFGGANLVTIMISRTDGTSIINPETLAKVKRITDKLLEVHGVIPYAVRSLSTVNSRYLKGTADALDASILFQDASRAPETPEELARTEFGIKNNASLGLLVAPGKDGKPGSATIIQADFRTGAGKVREGLRLPTTDPIAIYKDVNEIVAPENDGAHRVTAAGSPMIIGWVNSDGLPYVWAAFALVVLSVIIVHGAGFRSELGIVPTLALGFAGIVWAFGLQRLVEGEVLRSAAALLAPFIIIASAASHSVVFIKRFLTDELKPGISVESALAATVNKLFVPILVALGTELISFVVLAFVPFDNVRVLGLVTALGLLALIVLVPFLMVPMLTFWPERRLRTLAQRSQQRHDEGTGLVAHIGAKLIHPLVYNRKAQAAVAILAIAVTVLSMTPLFFGHRGDPASSPDGERSGFAGLREKLDIGQDNTYAIHNYLTRSWVGNPLYQMEMEIKERFGAVYTLSFLAESKEPGGVKTPQALAALERFSQDMQTVPEVKAVVGLPLFIKVMNRFMNEDNDQEFRIPDHDRAQMTINEALYFYTGGTPGAFDSVVNPTYNRAMLVGFVTDTSHATVNKVLRHAHSLIEKWDQQQTGVELRMAGGSLGIAGAFNASIERWLVLATALSAMASAIAAALMLRSITGPALLMLPLLLGMIVWVALIYILGIEFNSNVTAALAIGSGVGIDAEVYLLYRFREEYEKDGQFKRALFDAFTRVREPLIFSFSALFFGCLSVSFVPLYVGYVGFSMALILLTTFIFSFFVAPVVWSVLQPAFLTRGISGRGAGAQMQVVARRAGAR